ncbi:hypothetical protein J1605_008346 [Eschrichtius robustus]|uniref:Cytochrome c oxidase subunit 5A, mitochondrial n=1 Tax=Eschrichtius robustus TaxID=9764 RepID=A0AB34H016_ESCRO|nr:hypothetical protein J1605_008346 [Eschrichtius robustus]
MALSSSRCSRLDQPSRPPAPPPLASSPAAALQSIRCHSHGPHETDEEFDARWVTYFNKPDIAAWELRKGMNTLVGYDLVPEPQITDAALRACRRLNDFASAVRVLEVVQDKAGPHKEIYPYCFSSLPTATSSSVLQEGACSSAPRLPKALLEVRTLLCPAGLLRIRGDADRSRLFKLAQLKPAEEKPSHSLEKKEITVSRNRGKTPASETFPEFPRADAEQLLIKGEAAKPLHTP